MTWSFYVSGYLGSSIRYSSGLCYNTFPIKNLNQEETNELNEMALKLIDEREMFSDKTLSELYNPDKMPLNLRNIHNAIDKKIDSFYSKDHFKDKKERIEVLLNAYKKIEDKNLLI